MSEKKPKIREKISQSVLVMLLFDLTMSYIMAISDTPMKWKVKDVFKQFDQVGTALWDVLIDRLKKDGQETNFDEYVIQLDEVLRQYLDCRDPITLIALMKAFNQNEVSVVPEQTSDGEIIITRQLKPHNQRYLHASNS